MADLRKIKEDEKSRNIIQGLGRDAPTSRTMRRALSAMEEIVRSRVNLALYYFFCFGDKGIKKKSRASFARVRTIAAIRQLFGYRHVLLGSSFPKPRIEKTQKYQGDIINRFIR